ncbi:hypothetical protein MACH09_30250 [Vibrio sp. MACH09]|uniref:GNAT family N-acetyltransferase n=1 Tax=Vibrio sp. MACH09 TaxID=3025122 RepID=UPI00278F5AF9|nr:GNAT family N-acetyltransferase [Vibrio sp. MACH09]GLO62517.1 hypothetical protein MACH09_30250 [Vibrio sp. MACH09]
MNISFRQYLMSDEDECLSLFDKNCPEYFAVNERKDYEEFLAQVMDGYLVCQLDKEIIGAFGLFSENNGRVKLDWILLSPDKQCHGIGSFIMGHVLSQAIDLKAKVMVISTSHKAYQFFEKHGAVVLSEVENGWGPNMHRVEMELPIIC